MALYLMADSVLNMHYFRHLKILHSGFQSMGHNLLIAFEISLVDLI